VGAAEALDGGGRGGAGIEALASVGPASGWRVEGARAVRAMRRTEGAPGARTPGVGMSTRGFHVLKLARTMPRRGASMGVKDGEPQVLRPRNLPRESHHSGGHNRRDGVGRGFQNQLSGRMRDGRRPRRSRHSAIRSPGATRPRLPKRVRLGSAGGEVLLRRGRSLASILARIRIAGSRRFPPSSRRRAGEQFAQSFDHRL